MDRMTRDPATATERADEAFWRDFLTHGDPRELARRRFYKRLPRGPRCRLCAAPFAGLSAPLMRLVGRRQSNASPSMCNACFDYMVGHRGGAEVEATILFADIRGSTALAEGMTPHAFRDLLDRFYTTASRVVFDHDGVVDKFVGDELVAFFLPLLCEEHHAADAVDAARSLLQETGHADTGGPWVPLGAGVHTGTTWIGTVGDATHVELTALGDVMNTTSRLASHAGAGEILVSSVAAEAARLDPALEHRPLELKGKAEATEVVSLRVTPS
jgi:adenylate cyclase